MANTESRNTLERIEESQKQLRDSIETSKRLAGEAQALVDQAHKESERLSSGRDAAASSL